MKCVLSQFSEEIKEQFDLTIMMCSFEERSLSLIKNANRQQLGNVLIIYNEENEACRIQVKKAEEILGENCVLLSVGINDPLAYADRVLGETSKYKEAKNILIDVTTFTHEALLITLRICEMMFPNSNVKYAYANASQYCSEEIGEKKWLSKGITEVRSVLGYSGDLNPCNRDRLLVIVGYEYGRTIAAIEMIDPTELTLAYGKAEDATTEQDQDANAKFTDLVSSMAFAYPDIDKLVIPCNSPVAAAKAIVEYARNCSEENVIVLPMNNKLTTIAVEMAQRIEPAIQVCYVPAEVYNLENYSEPGEFVYFGEIYGEEIKERLNEIN